MGFVLLFHTERELKVNKTLTRYPGGLLNAFSTFCIHCLKDPGSRGTVSFPDRQTDLTYMILSNSVVLASKNMYRLSQTIGSPSLCASH